MHENQISGVLLDAGIQVHRALGPGLLESVYETALAHVLEQRGLHVERQVPIAVHFEGLVFDEAFRADLIVNGKVIVELKSVERIAVVHRKQVMTYVRLSGLQLGVLMNFGGATLKEGFERFVQGLLPER